ncbi:glycosyltransferase family 9 protein [Leptospira idonii]|uniref:Lipopolysaccharide heptosyltransferase family protein n=1 Tax=Leptospira idonii TaxID=1193500 RepID=A0A4R9LVM6_9LEPT|nr:glycosyltransferase family 9 protein [Leptospira idonii]TGN18303.1 hypothetical protein EHS15_12925 [Leptospira idonii]
MLLTLPVIKQYKKNFPGHETYLVTDISLIRPNEYLDRVISFSDIDFENFEKDFDRVIYMDYESNPEVHVLDSYAFCADIRLEDRTISWSLNESSLVRSKEILEKENCTPKFVTLQVQSGHSLRNYPMAHFQSLIGLIRETGMQVVVLSDKKNPLVDCINLAGKTKNIEEVAGIISLSDSFIGIDSGLLHISQALGKNTIAIFGSTNPLYRVTRPKNTFIASVEELDCLGCYHKSGKGAETLSVCKRGDLACMNHLSPEFIFSLWSRSFSKENSGLEMKIDSAIRSAEEYFSKSDMGTRRKKMFSDYRIRVERYLNEKRWTSKLRSVLKKLISYVR